MADENEDQRWLESLAGRDAAGDDAALREARAVREAILRRERAVEMAPQELENGLQRLLFRLRGEVLLAKPRAAANWTQWAMAASLVAVVGTLVFVGVDRGPDPDEVAVRGGKMQEISATEPAKAADAIAADLRALDITVVRREERNASVVEALVQDRADPKLAEVLSRHKLSAGESGPLLIRVVPEKK